MKDSNYKPDGTGVVMGDTKSMPDRGTSTGMDPGASVDLQGASIDTDAINRIGGISGATQSDPAAECYSPDPTFGERGEGSSGDHDDRY